MKFSITVGGALSYRVADGDGGRIRMGRKEGLLLGCKHVWHPRVMVKGTKIRFQLIWRHGYCTLSVPKFRRSGCYMCKTPWLGSLWNDGPTQQTEEERENNVGMFGLPRAGFHSRGLQLHASAFYFYSQISNFDLVEPCRLGVTVVCKMCCKI